MDALSYIKLKISRSYIKGNDIERLDSSYEDMNEAETLLLKNWANRNGWLVTDTSINNIVLFR